MQQSKIPVLTQSLPQSNGAKDNIPILRHPAALKPPTGSTTSDLSMKHSSQKKTKDPLVLFLQDAQKHRNVYADSNNSLPQNLSEILQRAAKLADILKTKEKSLNNNKDLEASRGIQFIRALAQTLQSILHTHAASNYRALGLTENASSEQATQHYQWLRRIFLCGEANNTQYEAVIRVTEAYAILRAERQAMRQFMEPVEVQPSTSSHFSSHSENMPRGEVDTYTAPKLSEYNSPIASPKTKLNLLKKSKSMPTLQGGKHNLTGLSGPQLAVTISIAILTIASVTAITWFARDPFIPAQDDSEIHDSLLPQKNIALAANSDTTKNSDLSNNLGTPAKTNNINPTAHELKQPTLSLAKANEKHDDVIVPTKPSSKLDTLLVLAQRQMSEEKFTRPSGDNAYETYREILHINPANAVALANLQKIVSYYQQKAERLIQQQEYKKAFTYVTRGLSVQPKHENLRKLLHETMKKLVPHEPENKKAK